MRKGTVVRKDVPFELADPDGGAGGPAPSAGGGPAAGSDGADVAEKRGGETFAPEELRRLFNLAAGAGAVSDQHRTQAEFVALARAIRRQKKARMHS